MEEIPFKSQDALAVWQVAALVTFCTLLVLAAYIAKAYTKRRNGESLSSWLKPSEGAKKLAAVEFEQRLLSRNARLYHLKIYGKEHIIFESDKGLIELDQKNSHGES